MNKKIGILIPILGVLLVVFYFVFYENQSKEIPIDHNPNKLASKEIPQVPIIEQDQKQIQERRYNGIKMDDMVPEEPIYTLPNIEKIDQDQKDSKGSIDALLEERDTSRKIGVQQFILALTLHYEERRGKYENLFDCVNNDFLSAGLDSYIARVPVDPDSSRINYGCKGEYYFRHIDSDTALVGAEMEGKNGNYCGDEETLKTGNKETIMALIDGCENAQGFVDIIDYTLE